MQEPNTETGNFSREIGSREKGTSKSQLLCIRCQSPLGDTSGVSIDPKVRALVFMNKESGVRTEISFRKSPLSWKALEALVGNAGESIPKAKIHSAMDTSDYQSTMHDGRLLKLLSRLKERLAKKGLPELWVFPGDNTVTLMQNIQQI